LPNGNRVIADLEGTAVTDRLPGQATVTDEVASVGLDDPQTVAVLGVVGLAPGDPTHRLVTRLRSGIEPHHGRVAEKAGHQIDVRLRHLPKAQA
jgi:hypothetical protein